MKPTIEQLRSGQVEWPILSQYVDSWENLLDSTLQCAIDGLWSACQVHMKHNCAECKAEMWLHVGSNTCGYCKTQVTWSRV